MLFCDNGMDAYPPTISTQQPGADIAEDGSGSSDVAVSHTCLKNVMLPYLLCEMEK